MDQNANTKICFEVRAPCSTSPPTPPCRISTISTPTEGTSTEEDFLQHQEYQTPLSNNNLLTTEGLGPQPIQQSIHTPLPKRLTTKLHLYRRGSQPIPPLPKRDPQHNHPITSTEEGFTNIRVFTTMRFTTNNLNHFSFFFSFLFPQKQDPKQIRIGDSSSVENKCFWKQATKKNLWENTCNMIELKI